MYLKQPASSVVVRLTSIEIITDTILYSVASSTIGTRIRAIPKKIVGTNIGSTSIDLQLELSQVVRNDFFDTSEMNLSLVNLSLTYTYRMAGLGQREVSAES